MKLSEIREAGKKIHDQCAEIYNSTESVVKLSNEKREKLEAEQHEISRVKISENLMLVIDDIINLYYVDGQHIPLCDKDLAALRDKLNEIL